MVNYMQLFAAISLSYCCWARIMLPDTRKIETVFAGNSLGAAWQKRISIGVGRGCGHNFRSKGSPMMQMRSWYIPTQVLTVVPRLCYEWAIVAHGKAFGPDQARRHWFFVVYEYTIPLSQNRLCRINMRKVTRLYIIILSIFNIQRHFSRIKVVGDGKNYPGYVNVYV